LLFLPDQQDTFFNPGVSQAISCNFLLKNSSFVEKVLNSSSSFIQEISPGCQFVSLIDFFTE
jgi:hypothetical protein